MSNAMRIGKRSLAGLASGALLLSGIAIVAAQPAQAAPAAAIYCAGNGTGVSGTAAPADASVIQPNCSVIAAQTAVAAVGPTTGTGNGYPTGINSVQLTISGSGVWQGPSTASADWAITNSGKTLTALTTGAGLDDTTNFGVLVQSVGVNTITVGLSTSSTVAGVNPANTSAGGDFTVTGTGPDAGILVSQAYKAVAAATSGNGAALGIIHLVDGAGSALLPGASPAARVTFQNVNPAGGSVAAASYASGDCLTGTSAGLLKTDPTLNTGALLNTVPACEITSAAGLTTTANSGVWINWTGSSATVPGNYTSSFTFTAASGRSYTGSISYTVSEVLAGGWTVAFDKTNYAPGQRAAISLCATDLNGLPVPDGLGWSSAARTVAGVAFNAPVFNVRTGAAIANPERLFNRSNFGTSNSNVQTYGGCAVGAIVVPQTEMVLSVSVAVPATAETGWAAAQRGTAKAATAIIGNPEPTKPTIMIEGTRGKGDNANMVFVEGTTTELAGKTVTPYFRFPGQTGFTAGTGIRTVDAQGNFAWERKTGKQIAVQFRAGDVKSNTVLIEAK